MFHIAGGIILAVLILNFWPLILVAGLYCFFAVLALIAIVVVCKNPGLLVIAVPILLIWAASKNKKDNTKVEIIPPDKTGRS
jgi:hypothetical protein